MLDKEEGRKAKKRGCFKRGAGGVGLCRAKVLFFKQS